jgi:hypothetical protein
MKTIIALTIGLALGCRTLVFANQPPEYLQSFDPQKGFKPAQKDLTEIFLQIAGSLEFYGSPEPYLRHMAAEHKRIDAKYQNKYGKLPASCRPENLTDDYIDLLSRFWKRLSPGLELDSFAKEIGNTMRDGIRGTRGSGTMIVEIFNEHQNQALDAMAGKGSKPADFEALRTELTTRLELDRERVDDRNYSIPRRDAVRSALIIRGITTRLYKKIDEALKPADALRIKTVLSAIFIDVGKMAESEFEIAIAEWAIDRASPSTVAK